LSRTHQIVRPLNELTVRDNVIAGACYGKDNLSIRAAAATAEEVLETVRLAQRAELLASSLNVAQKKRLELARALAAGPDLLLLDEVLAGLNNTEVSGMLDTIRHIRDQGVTIIMIEHIMHAVMNLSDRIIVLNYGEMIADGPPAEVSQNEQVIEAYLGNPELAEQILEEGRA
jgi:branched-chain amino acid transport system ATP-binding protein